MVTCSSWVAANAPAAGDKVGITLPARLGVVNSGLDGTRQAGDGIARRECMMANA